MKKIMFLVAACVCSIVATAQVEYLYDFNSLDEGTQCLNGQDNWSTHYQTAETSQDFDIGYSSGDLISPDESIAVFYPYGGSGVGRTATRKATDNFNFSFQNGGIMDLEMDVFRTWWGSFFGVGFDGDGDGNILPSMTAVDGGVYVRASNTNDNATTLNLPDGSSILIASYTQSGWTRYKMSFDFNAYSGAGSVTVFAKPGCTGEWLQLAEATEVNMGLTPGSGDKLDYQVWDGLFFHSQGGVGAFDNLLVRQQPDGNVQYIAMDDIPNQLTTNPPLALVATSTSGLEVSFEIVSGPATINGNILTLTGETGYVTLKASQAGDETWLPAPNVFKTFEVYDALAYIPEITIRRPYEDTKVYMPELYPTMIVVSAYIDHSDVLHIEKVNCEVDGQTLEAVTYYPDDPENGYYSCEWTPSAYGVYDMTVTVNTTGGQVTTVSNTFEVTDEYEDMNVVTLNGDLICTPSVQAIVGNYAMPSHVGAFNSIIANYDHNCVNGNCDTYDRVGGINVRNYRGEWMELFRYISPFGVQCEDACDVSDYTTILQGLVEFEFYFVTWNGAGFNPILTFMFTKGAPDYLYADITEIWNATYPFGDYANQQPVPVVDFDFNPNTQAAKLKVTTTGHNWSSNTSPNYSFNTGNAAEFYEATHHFFIDGENKFEQHLWPISGSCTPNPAGCQPQNGTWTYGRSGWCPGSIGMIWNWDLSDYVGNGSAKIQYEFDPDYIDFCHPNYPDCQDGVTCVKCNAPDNPILIVAGKVISYSNNANIFFGDKNTAAVIENKIAMYPNPSSENVTFLSDSDESLMVEILDMNGQLMKYFYFSGSKTISVKDLTKGLYLVKIMSGSHITTQKLVVR